MVEARFKRDGVRHTLTVTGHATGSEATCAAVSTIVQAMETAIDYLNPPDWSKRLKPGDVEFCAEGPGVCAAFEIAKLSFMRLAAADPERVRVIEEEDNDGI